MLINKEYLIERMTQLAKEKQAINQHDKVKTDKLYLIKLRFPKWLRSIIFHYLNPVYSVYLQRKASRNKNNCLKIIPLQPFALDLLQYLKSDNLQFETNHYYSKEDEPKLATFIDNNLKSMIPGYPDIPMGDEQRDIVEKKKILNNNIKKQADRHVLSLDGHSYSFPVNSFQEYAFIHDYGLKYVPDYIKDYIAGKDFLDLGAFWGDTAILFLKYAPSMVYAYEPVQENFDVLQRTIDMNNKEAITAIKKGIGDKTEDLDIYINPLNLSSCSLNDNIVNNELEKETIHVTTVDEECKNRKVGVIKMDIEGFEYAAIQGALETIKRDKPVLLISIYHTAKDFFEIPPVIKELEPSYEFRFVNLEVMKPVIDKIFVAYPKQGTH